MAARQAISKQLRKIKKQKAAAKRRIADAPAANAQAVNATERLASLKKKQALVESDESLLALAATGSLSRISRIFSTTQDKHQHKQRKICAPADDFRPLSIMLSMGVKGDDEPQVLRRLIHDYVQKVMDEMKETDVHKGMRFARELWEKFASPDWQL